MYFLYSVLSAAGMILLTPYFLIRGAKKYLPSLPERFGFTLPAALYSFNGGPRRAIWIHAVSVGEVLAALPLARSLKERFPAWRLVVSTTTVTGQRLARERMKFADAVFYFPFDWQGPIRRVLKAMQPGLIIVCETEIWPNFLRQARRDGVPVVFVNGRISERSFRGFAFAVRAGGGLLRSFLRRILSNATLYLMQSEGDAARLIDLGAPPERVMVSGNMKHDLPLPAPGPFVRWLEEELRRSDRGPVVVAGSVLAGEEVPVLEAFEKVAQRWPRALLVMAPRKPERFAAATALIEAAGWQVVHRSGLPLDQLDQQASGALACGAGTARTVLLLDTIGELAALYSLADAVFIGGSLELAGGHNPLEPALFGKAPVFGPSMENFRDIGSGLLAANGAIEVHSGAQLAETWISLLSDPERSMRLGHAAREFVKRSGGATTVTLEHVAGLLAAPNRSASRERQVVT